jgi:drug/metabolite transporter (DMT)-like permease
MHNSQMPRPNGLQAALISALFLGLAPVFGRHAILLGVHPIAAVALRTAIAAALLLIFILVYQRKYLYIYPAGLIGCFLAGGLNGLGSLLYYAALGRIEASLGQLFYSFYPLFVALLFWLDRQTINRLTILRLILALPALALLTQTGSDEIDMLGIAMMTGAALLYALHLPINQRVLYEMPAQTVTLYTLFAMSAIVVPAYFLAGAPAFHISPGNLVEAWGAVLALTLVTFLSRLALFYGVKYFGGLQTAILGLGELLVTIFFAHLLLGEQLSHYQWLGALLLILSLFLVVFERIGIQRPNHSHGLLRWLSPPNFPPDIR